MPDPQASPAPSKTRGKTKSRLAAVLVLVLGAGGIFLWMRPATPTRAAENHSGVGSTVALFFHLRRLLDPFLPKVVVVSPLEIPPMVPVQSLGTVG